MLYFMKEFKIKGDFMIGVRLPSDLEARLNKLVQETHRTKSYYLKRALEEFLEEQEAALLAVSRWEKIQSGSSKLIPLEEIEKELGIRHDG